MTQPLSVSQSPYSVHETVTRLESCLEEKNISIFARIDHQAAARQSGLELDGEVVVVFGDPKVGTLLMRECPEIGIELPLKILIWQDNQTFIGYVDPKNLLLNYEVTKSAGIIEKMSGLMQMLVSEVIKQ